MDDVLSAYIRARREQVTPASATAVAQADKVSSHPGDDSDPFLNRSLPYPLSALAALVKNHRDYRESCSELGKLLKMISARVPIETPIMQALRTGLPQDWVERFLLILLEVQPSDLQTAVYVLQFRHLKRQLLRVERRMPLNAAEAAMAREIIQALNLTGYLDLEPFAVQAVNAFRAVQARQIPTSADLGLLIYLIRREVAAMGERKNWLEGDLSAGDPDSVARLTPHLKLLEDRMQKGLEMAQRLGSFEPLRDAPMGLENALGPFFFAQLRDGLAASPDLALLVEALDMQRAKLVPTHDLIALSTLCRWILEARDGQGAHPLDWIRMALSSYHHGHFRVPIEGAMGALEPLMADSRVEWDGDLLLGNFGENPYHAWVGQEGLTRPFRRGTLERPAPNLRNTVLANMHRENIILKLLESAKVYETPGLVALIAECSRSASVLSKIATRRELHSGNTNGRVPAVLLKSPVSIPTTLLRTMINPIYVPLAELRSLFRGRSTLRSEVAQELGNYLRSVRAI